MLQTDAFQLPLPHILVPPGAAAVTCVPHTSASSLPPDGGTWRGGWGEIANGCAIQNLALREAARFCWGAVLPMPSGSRDNLGRHKLPPQGGQSPHFLLGAEPCTEHAIRGSSAPARRLPSAPRGPPEQTATFSWKGRWMLWSVCLLTTSERLYVRTQFLLCCE